MANGKKTSKDSVVDIEDVVPAEAVPLEKIEDAEAVEEVESAEEEADGPELDDEELNPFKDKWEE